MYRIYFVGAIFAHQRRRAKQLGIEEPRPGAVAFTQNFTATLLLYPHYHVLVAEGGIVRRDGR